MNKYQINAIRRSFQRDKRKDNGVFLEPVMRKEMKQLKTCFNLNGKPPKSYLLYKLTKGGNTFKIYLQEFKNRNLAIITRNEKIIYWIDCHDGHYWSAWRQLTGVYHGYGEGSRSTCWTWVSAEDFDCVDCYLTNYYNNYFAYLVNDPHLLTPYQVEKWTTEHQYYVDKKIISKEEIEEIAKKENIHI